MHGRPLLVVLVICAWDYASMHLTNKSLFINLCNDEKLNILIKPDRNDDSRLRVTIVAYQNLHA